MRVLTNRPTIRSDCFLNLSHSFRSDVTDELPGEASLTASTTLSTVKLPGFWRGGSSLKLIRNLPTMGQPSGLIS